MEDDGNRNFLRAFNKPDLRPLTGAELLEVLPRAQAGEERAVTRMLGAVARLILRHARIAARRNYEVSVSDLANRAAMYLAEKAINKYDPTESSWSTYAGWWIKASTIRQGRMDRTIRIPAFNYGPEYEEQLAARMGLDSRISLWDVTRPRRLDEFVAEGLTRGEATLIDERTAEDGFEEAEPWSRLAEVLRPPTFAARQAHIIWRCLRGDTLAMVGKDLELSRERVRQLRDQAVPRIREQLVKCGHGETTVCPGWRERCGGVRETFSGHCRACWAEIAMEAGAMKINKGHIQVLRTIANGAEILSYDDLAKAVGKSASTVKTYISDLRRFELLDGWDVTNAGKEKLDTDTDPDVEAITTPRTREQLLADPTTRLVFSLIVDNPGISTADIADGAKMPNHGEVREAVAELRLAGLVEPRQKATWGRAWPSRRGRAIADAEFARPELPEGWAWFDGEPPRAASPWGKIERDQNLEWRGRHRDNALPKGFSRPEMAVAAVDVAEREFKTVIETPPPPKPPILPWRPDAPAIRLVYEKDGLVVEALTVPDAVYFAAKYQEFRHG